MIFIVVSVITLVIALSFILISRSRMKRGEPPAFAIGGEMAEARRAEIKHFHSCPDAPSPMPNIKYDFWQGDTDLTSPNVTAVDQDIASFLTAFAAGNDSARGDMCSRIKMEEFYQLVTFAKRMAVFALRTGDFEQLKIGLTAVAAIDSKRVDFRDVLLTLSLLHHSAERNGLGARGLFEDAALLAAPDTAKLISGFLNRAPENRDIRRSWCHDEITTDAGLGFIGWGSKPYQPSYDLKDLAIQVKRVLAADRYQPDSVAVGSDLPPAWFTTQTPAQQEGLDSVLRRITGAATVWGKLRPDHHQRSDAQQLTIFIVECSDDGDSAFLQTLSNVEAQRHASLGIIQGRLFCLVVARSFVGGVESYETPQLLERFKGPLTALLRRAQNAT